MYVLGINGDMGRNAHDPSAFLYKNGVLVYASEEERYNRIRFSSAMLPENAINNCLNHENITLSDVQYVAFPQNTWGEIFQERVNEFFIYKYSCVPEVKFYNHHYSHAASSYYNSTFDKALVITADGSGDGISTAIFLGDGKNLKLLEQKKSYPDSLGLFYSMITQYLGFTKNCDEYKVMSMVGYGNKNINMSEILSEIGEGDFALNPNILNESYKYIKFPHHITKQERLYNETLDRYLKCIPRKANTLFLQKHMDIAASTQAQLESIVKNMIRKYIKKYNVSNICLAGGVFMNCLLNGEIYKMNEVTKLYVPPICDDSGTAMGAALLCLTENNIDIIPIQHASYGNEYSNNVIVNELKNYNIKFKNLGENIYEYTAEKLSEGNIIAWHQGRMEIGARALGNRSILANPKDLGMKDKVNKIKKRECFQPFGSSILDEKKVEYYNIDKKCSDQYMTITFDSKKEIHNRIPAVLHVDGTSRVQTVKQSTHQEYYKLISAFETKSKVPVLLNTSLNRKGEPITQSISDSLAVFFSTSLDGLVLENVYIEK